MGKACICSPSLTDRSPKVSGAARIHQASILHRERAESSGLLRAASGWGAVPWARGAPLLLSHCNSLGPGSATALDSPYQSSHLAQHCALTALYSITHHSHMRPSRDQAELQAWTLSPQPLLLLTLAKHSAVCLQISHCLSDKISQDKTSISDHYLIMHTETQYTSANFECVHSRHWSILLHFSILLTRI